MDCLVVVDELTLDGVVASCEHAGGGNLGGGLGDLGIGLGAIAAKHVVRLVHCNMC